jgi:hypothetical protein
MAKEPFSLKDVSTLKEGILAEEAGTKPLSRFGVDFSLRPSTVFGALPGIGDLAFLGQAIGKTQLESSATNLLNSTSPNQLDTGLGATIKRAGTGKSATSAVINEIKDFKQSDPYSITENITRDDIQRYMMSKRPDLDLAPIQIARFTRQELAQGDGGGYYGDKQDYYTQPFSSGRTAQNISGTGFRGGISPQDRAMIEEDQAIAGFSSFRDAMKGGYYDNELKSVSDFAEDNIKQSNITNLVDEKTGKSLYDPAFARAVTRENQGDTADAEGTFLCTAFFEMKDLPRNIYKYDKLYGQQVNRRIYDGYAIWGKPMAEKVKNKKLAYKIMKPIVCAWAEQMAFDLSNGKVGKNRLTIKIGKVIGEAICYSIGLFINLKGDKNGTRNRNRQHGEERRVVRGENGVLKKRGRPRTNRRATS